MEYVLPFLRAQSTLLADIEARLRDTANARWTEVELYRALSDALTRWSGRVSVPFIYELSGGWVNGTSVYALPDYMSRKIQPQRKVTTPYVNSGGASSMEMWADVLGWDVEPDGTGGQELRLQWNEGTEGATTEGRILWWGEQGPLPTTPTTVQTQITAASTSLILGGIVDVGQSGYVYVDKEWIQYAGYTDNGTYTTLTNLVRGINNTTAATHNSAVSVYVGVAMPHRQLQEQLLHQAMANAFAYGLIDVNETERDRYERNMGYYQQLADEFWMRWMPNSPQIRLSRRAIG